MVEAKSILIQALVVFAGMMPMSMAHAIDLELPEKSVQDPKLSLVKVTRPRAAFRGSGVVIANDTVVTNCHVLFSTEEYIFRLKELSPEQWPTFTVQTIDWRTEGLKKQFPARLTHMSQRLDMCVLHVPDLEAPIISVETETSVGDRTTAMGFGEQSFKASEGSIVLKVDHQDFDSKSLLILSNDSLGGMSGGMLLSERGRLIGLVTAKTSHGEVAGRRAGSMAIPVAWFQTVTSAREHNTEPQFWRPENPIPELNFR